MRQDNFRKCSRCHRFNEIFKCVINRRRNTESRIFRQKPYSNLMEMNGKIKSKYITSKKAVKYLIETRPKRWEKISRKKHYPD